MLDNLRIPPHSLEAEEAILGSILLNPEESMNKAVESGVKTETFYDRRHQGLFDALTDMDLSRSDAILIGQILKDTGKIDKVGGYDHLDRLMANVSGQGHIESYSDVICRKHRARQMIVSASDLIDKAYVSENPDSEVVAHIESIEAIRPAEKVTMETVIDDAMREAVDIAEGRMVFLPFPWSRFQLSTFGIPTGAVTPLLGRDKTGKSRLAMFITRHWITNEIPTLVFSFEDGKRRWLQAMAATVGGYDSFKTRRNPSSDHMNTVRKSMETLKRLPIYVVDDSMSAEDVVATIGAYKRKFGIRAVVIDGFKDISESKGENRTSAENHIFETIKKGALRYDVGVLQIEHPHDVEDGKWLSRRNIRGSKQRSHSARMFLVYQDSGFPDSISKKYGLIDGDNIVLDCQACSYGERAIVPLFPDLERGRFVEVVDTFDTAEGEG